MTDMSQIQIGDVVPMEGGRGIVGAKLERPVWHPLRVIPGKEVASVEALKGQGVNAFVPLEERERTVNGVRRKIKRPTVTQIIYAQFRRQPHWDVLKERRFITGVFCVGGRPVRLPSDVIRIVRGLPTQAERIAAAKAEMMRVNIGEVVQLSGGPFDGLRVEVTDVVDRRVWWATVLESGMPIHGEVSRDEVKKMGIDTGA